MRALVILVLVSLAIVTGPPARAQEPASREYPLKALYLLNFTQFVDWPAESFLDESTPLVIGVLGEDPFGNVLDEAIRGETVKSRTLVIKRSHRIEELKSCHVLFISKSAKGRLSALLKTLDRAPILTVSEVEGFSRQGGIITFFLQANKVRFDINAEAAKSCGLKISSQLLQLSAASP